MAQLQKLLNIHTYLGMYIFVCMYVSTHIIYQPRWPQNMHLVQCDRLVHHMWNLFHNSRMFGLQWCLSLPLVLIAYTCFGFHAFLGGIWSNITKAQPYSSFGCQSSPSMQDEPKTLNMMSTVNNGMGLNLLPLFVGEPASGYFSIILYRS